MKVWLAWLLGLLVPLASAGAGELEVLRERCAEQERQIRDLELENTRLRSLLERQPGEEGVVRGEPGRVLDPKAGATPAAGAAGRYTVRPGDTLARIARRYGTTPETLAAMNRLRDPSVLAVGATLEVPAGGSPTSPAASGPATTPTPAKDPATPQPQPADAGKLYKVKAGDTYYRIARANRTTTDALQAANPGVDPARLRVGQQLRIGPPASPAAGPPRPNNPSPSTAATPGGPVPAASPSAPDLERPVSPSGTSPAPAPKAAKPEPPAEPAAVRLIRITAPITVGEFATKHGTTVEQINDLNGQSLTGSTLIAKDSELYVPAR